MDDAGSASVLALWLAGAATAVGMSALYVARERSARAAESVCEAHARIAVAGAALLAAGSNFSEPNDRRTIDGCVLETTRRFWPDGRSVVLTCDVRAGRYHGVYRIGWVRTADEWRVAWWTEE
jgi:hypothetical protein